MKKHLYVIGFFAYLITCTVLFFKEVTVGSVNAIPHIDKLAHFVIFFLLAYLTHLAFQAPFYLKLVGLICYGGLIELGQSQLPHRMGSWLDLLADCLGLLVFYALEYVIRQHKINKQLIALNQQANTCD